MKKTLLPLLKGLVAGLVSIILLYGLFSVLMSLLDSPKQFTYPATLLGLLISLPITGYATTKADDQHSVAKGGFCGLLYIALLFLVSAIINKDFSIGYQGFLLVFIGIAAGSAGGLMYAKKDAEKKKAKGSAIKSAKKAV